MSEDFRTIYRILKAVRSYELAEEGSLLWFEPERLKTTAENRDRLVLKLIDKGYLKGFHIIRDIDGQTKPVIVWRDSSPEITIEGMEYLEENGLMKKAAELVRGIREVLP